mmetsp:Transcript_79246/g.128416  ORF Transcript_79246/g.128416 Transcript_79246/m.128416 type:complete len:81 (+) Transcript_79246:632-874(+)
MRISSPDPCLFSYFFRAQRNGWGAERARKTAEAKPRHSKQSLSAPPVSLCKGKKIFQEQKERRLDEVVSEEAGGGGFLPP